VILVTEGISSQEATEIGISATSDFQEAFAAALARHGSAANVGVITQGADIMAAIAAMKGRANARRAAMIRT